LTTPVKNDKKTVFRWAMYDWANSAYATTSGAIVAAFFTGQIVGDEGWHGLTGETIWSLVVSTGAFLLFLIMPVLGAVADYTSAKRKFLWAFAVLGSIFTMATAFVPDRAIPLFLLIFLISQIGFVAANVFYDGYLLELATDDTIDKVSSKGYAMGYIGGGLYVLIAFVIILMSGDDSVTGLSETGAARVGIFGAGVWWILFTMYSIRRLPDIGESMPIPEHLSHKAHWRAYLEIGFGRTIATAKKLRSFPQLLLFIIAFMFYNDGTQTVINISGAYAEGTLNLELEHIITAFLIVQFIAFFGALMFGSIAGRIGARSKQIEHGRRLFR
jgi:UMF1 family MFS transporter